MTPQRSKLAYILGLIFKTFRRKIAVALKGLLINMHSSSSDYIDEFICAENKVQ